MSRLNAKNIPQDTFVECATRHALDGGSQQDVADELEVSLGNVANRVSRYRKRTDEQGGPINIPQFQRAAMSSKIDSDAANAQIAAMIAEREKSAL